MRIAGAGGSGEDRDRLLERLDDLASLGLSLRVERLEGVFEGRLLRRLDDGILLFSGSLYAMTLTGIRALGAITPLGGVSFMAGWAALALAATKDSGETQQ